MKSPWFRVYVVIAAVVIAGLLESQWSRAQEPATDLTEADMELKAQRKEFDLLQAKLAVAEASRALAEEQRKMGPSMMGKLPLASGSMAAIRKAAEELRDAEGDDARADAEAKLRGLLEDYFDEDMERRASDLQEIEKRVSKLRAQLERRGDHKPEIIDLQIKVLVNEAEGLGFFSEMESTGFIFAPSGERWRITAPNFELPVPVTLPAPAVAPVPPASPADRPRIEK